MNAELFFEFECAHIVAVTQAAICVCKEFGHDEQRDALGSRRRIRQTRQHQMNDVLC